jgi:DNA-directed RNA polymerase subunit H (RpoH/RPB5)
MSQSRVQELADQLTDDAENIFDSLKNVLLPREDLTNQEELEHILHRTKLLCKETIPANLPKI